MLVSRRAESTGTDAVRRGEVPVDVLLDETALHVTMRGCLKQCGLASGSKGRGVGVGGDEEMAVWWSHGGNSRFNH